MDIKELQNIIQENGVVGAGGAGFPTYMKLTDKANTILMNCAECEPLLKLHRQLLEKHAYEIMKTFHMVQETVGAAEVHYWNQEILCSDSKCSETAYRGVPGNAHPPSG